MNIIIVLIVFILFTIIYLITQRKKIKDYEEYILYGKELYFERKDFTNHIDECKRRLLKLNPIYDKYYLSNDIRKAVNSVIILETGWLSDKKAKDIIINKNNILGITKSSTNTLWYFRNINECIDFFMELLKRYRIDLNNQSINGSTLLLKLYEKGYNPEYKWYLDTLNIYLSL